MVAVCAMGDLTEWVGRYSRADFSTMCILRCVIYTLSGCENTCHMGSVALFLIHAMSGACKPLKELHLSGVYTRILYFFSRTTRTLFVVELSCEAGAEAVLEHSLVCF